MLVRWLLLASKIFIRFVRTNTLNLYELNPYMLRIQDCRGLQPPRNFQVASIQQLILDNSSAGKWDFIRSRATKTLTAFAKWGYNELFD
jgi:hypothetical protein